MAESQFTEAQKAQMDFAKRDKELSAPIVGKLREVVEKISKDKGYTLVLGANEAGVIYVKPNDNITEEVIKSYDKTYKK